MGLFRASYNSLISLRLKFEEAFYDAEEKLERLRREFAEAKRKVCQESGKDYLEQSAG